MGLISNQIVEVGIGGKNAQHYISKGYDIPRSKRGNIIMGSKILVKVEDLTKTSKSKVKVECDCCNEIITVTHANYVNMNHDGKYYCKYCSMKVFCSGENNYRYNPNLTDEEREFDRKFYPGYVDFIKRVLARDNHTCQCCNKKRDIQVHHLDSCNWCKERITDDTNGITLCGDCHKNFHGKYGYGDNTKEQFLEWIGNKELNLSVYNGDIPSTKWLYCVEDDIVIEGKYDNSISKKEYDGMYTAAKGVSKGHKVNSYKNKHYIFYDDYLFMNDEDILKYVLERIFSKNGLNNMLICLNNNLIFSNSRQANRWSGKSGSSGVAKGEHSYAGRNPITNEPIRWKFLSDYIIENNLTLEDYRNIYKNNLYNGVYDISQFEGWGEYIEELPEEKWMYCIEDDEIIKQPDGSIRDVCNRRRNHTSHKGKHYIWYKDYLDMSKDDILRFMIECLHKGGQAPVICLNNHMVFERISVAEKWLGTDGLLYGYIRKDKPFTLSSKINYPTYWKYLDEYLLENNCTLDDYYTLWNNRHRKEEC